MERLFRSFMTEWLTYQWATCRRRKHSGMSATTAPPDLSQFTIATWSPPHQGLRASNRYNAASLSNQSRKAISFARPEHSSRYTM